MNFNDHHTETRADLDKTGIYTIYHLRKPNYYYIGSASKYDKKKYNDIGFLQRWRNHYSLLKRGVHHNKHLQRVVSKYGIDGIRFAILESCNPFDCITREVYYIRKYKSEYNVFNFNDNCFSLLGTKQTDETIKKKNRNRRPVYQYDLSGKFIKKWPSATAAKNAKVGTSRLLDCLNNNYGSSGGFQWSYSNAPRPPYKQKYWRIEEPVYQFNIKGDFIKEYPSPSEAAKSTGIPCVNILRSLNKEYFTGSGYVWSYSRDGFTKPQNKKRSPVVQYDEQMNVVREYDSISEAAEELKTGTTNIVNCCKQKPHCKTVRGYIFRYKAA